MRIWRRQKVIGFDVCKIVILTGHDIQMTWQPPISTKACVSTLQGPGWAIMLAFSSWVSNLSVFGNQSVPRFFHSDVVMPRAVSTVWKIKAIFITYFQYIWLSVVEIYSVGEVRQPLSQPTLALASLSLQPPFPMPFIIPRCVLLWSSVSTGTVISATINRINQHWHWALWSRWRV